MEEALKYLATIDEINRAERSASHTRGERLERALRAARDAWAALPPSIQTKLSPPPDIGLA